MRIKRSALQLLRRLEPPARWSLKSQGLRMFRSDKLDELPTPEPPARNDHLRELVDALPAKQRLVIERTFFGVATINEVAKEMKISGKTARHLRSQALQALREALLEAD